MIKPEQLPDEVIKAALLADERLAMREVIAAALNAWPGSYSLMENDSAVIRDVAAIILPLPTETINKETENG